MGIFLNPTNEGFKEVANSMMYVDKTGLLTYTNSVLESMQKYICVSRPRRVGINYDKKSKMYQCEITESK